MRNRTHFYHAIFFVLLTLSLTNCSGGSSETSAAPEYPVMKKPAKKSDAVEVPAAVKKLLATNTCLGCHKVDKKLVGPSYLEVAKRGYTEDELIALIKNPKSENWPDYPPMAPMEWLADEDLATIASWIVSLNDSE
jgi:cytochrome c551/c552